MTLGTLPVSDGDSYPYPGAGGSESTGVQVKGRAGETLTWTGARWASAATASDSAAASSDSADAADASATAADASATAADASATAADASATAADASATAADASATAADASATAAASAKPVDSLLIVCSDEVTPLVAADGVATFRLPYAFTLTGIRASLTTAQASGASLVTVDVNLNGTTLMSSDKLVFDNTEKTTTTAATPPALTTTVLADDGEISVDIDQVGLASIAAGLKVTLIGHRT